MLIHLKRITKSGFVNFWRSGVVALASVVVITATLFVIGWLYLGQAFLDFSLAEIESKVDISVSFEPYATETDILALKEELELQPYVSAVDYSSREAELVDFRERNQDNPLILESLDEVGNPLGARLNIQATSPAHYEAVAGFLSSDSALSPDGRNLIYTVNYKKDSINQLSSFIDSVRRIGSAIAIILILISILTVFSTVSLAIHISREEISVMRLVGAENRYIRGPFVIEGVIAGILGALLALVLLYPSVIWVKGASASFLLQFDLLNHYLSHFPALFFLILAIGILLSVIASTFAVRKYLKV